MSRQERSVLGWGAFAVAIAALVLALFGLRDSGSADSGTNGGSEATVVEIELSEFAITPATPTIPSGKVILKVTNKGSMVHNLSLPSLG
jgi:hypothetical protein